VGVPGLRLDARPGWAAWQGRALTARSCGRFRRTSHGAGIMMPLAVAQSETQHRLSEAQWTSRQIARLGGACLR
jgi:hypothetical protein